MSFLFDGFHHVEPYLMTYGVTALFLAIFLESCGLPTPGEASLVAAGLLAAKGDLDIAHALLAAIAGAVIGSSLGYGIGRFGGRPALQRFGPLVRLTPDRLTKMEALFRAKGAIIVVTARFVVLLRQINGFIAGSVAMPWPKFLAANAAGGVAWTAVWCLTPYYFAHLFEGAK